MKYRRREPETFDAIQYDGTNGQAVADSIYADYSSVDHRGTLLVRCIDSESSWYASKGDWMVWGESVPFVIPDKNFHREFEPVEPPDA